MAKRFACGLVVGKFSPLHKGHEYLIGIAAGQCEKLYLISYSQPELPGCEAPRRARWLRDRVPWAHSLVVTPGQVADWRRSGLNLPAMPDNDAEDGAHRRFTALLCGEVLGISVDAVFSCEDYGAGFAAALAGHFGRPVEHVMVDRDRLAVPVSASRIRTGVHAERDFLAPEVYRDFVKRVAFLGGESTGKSTMSAALAQAFGTQWVAEYGRSLWEQRGGKLEYVDYLHIAQTQLAREDAARLLARRYLFCDTAPLTTLLYCLDQFGCAEAELETLARQSYDRIYLCLPDFPLVQDGTRRDEAFRLWQHEWYLSRLTELGADFAILSGNHAARLASVQAELT